MAAKPSSDRSFAFIGGGVRMNSGTSGRNTLRGCGSKVSTSAGTPRRSASSSARSSTAWWPRCTPSKLPIATTPPRRPPSSRAHRRLCAETRSSQSYRSFGMTATTWNPCLSRNACELLRLRIVRMAVVARMDAARNVERVDAVVGCALDVGQHAVADRQHLAAADARGQAPRRPPSAPPRRSAHAACRRSACGRRAAHSRAPARRRTRSAGRRARPRCRDWRR